MANHHAPKAKPRLSIQDSVENSPTDQSDKLKPDLNKTTASPDFEPVPEERANLDSILGFLQKYGFILTVISAISAGLTSFLMFRNDLADARHNINSHSQILERQGAEGVSLDRRLIKVEKDLDFVGQRLKEGESDIRDLKALSQFLERQQAILSDRSERLLNSDK